MIKSTMSGICGRGDGGVSLGQLEALLDYLEIHPELALGTMQRGKEGRCLAKRLWAKCAEKLNSVSANCIRKSEKEWRLYFNEYKSKLKRKLNLIKKEQRATGGGVAKVITLTPLQERLYTILGRDIGEPLPGVRQNPLHVDISPVAHSTSIMADTLENLLKNVASEEMVEVLVEDNNLSTDRIEILETFELPVSQSILPTTPPVPSPAPVQPRRRRRPANERFPPVHETSTTNKLMEMEQLHAEVVREHTAALLDNAAATRDMAAATRDKAAAWREMAATRREIAENSRAITGLTQALYTVYPAQENKRETH